MKIKHICALAMLLLTFASCIKNKEIVYEGSQIEFDASVYNANASGLTYPIVTRLPGYGRTILTAAVSENSVVITPADPLLTRTSGTVKFRVNLVSAQRSTATDFTYRVVPDVTTAVDGVHYTTTGTFTIPANSSFGEITLNILNPGATTAGPRVIVLELIGTDEIKVSENDKRLGISIAQN